MRLRPPGSRNNASYIIIEPPIGRVTSLFKTFLGDYVYGVGGLFGRLSKKNSLKCFSFSFVISFEIILFLFQIWVIFQSQQNIFSPISGVLLAELHLRHCNFKLHGRCFLQNFKGTQLTFACHFSKDFFVSLSLECCPFLQVVGPSQSRHTIENLMRHICT